jgi:hypothetical protein
MVATLALRLVQRTVSLRLLLVLERQCTHPTNLVVQALFSIFRCTTTMVHPQGLHLVLGVGHSLSGAPSPSPPQIGCG